MSARIDVVVVTHQSARHVAACLDSIAASRVEAAIETVVVDNASSDGTAAVVRSHPSQPRLVANERNLGFAAACNQAIRATSGDLVLLLNPDARLLPDTLERLLHHLDANPRVAIVGPRLHRDDGALQPDVSATGLPPSFLQALHEYTRLGVLRPQSRWQRDYFLTGWSRRTTRPVAMVQGACLLVRRAVLEQVGLLDERFFLYFEETDLCKRVADAGHEVHYVGDAMAIHLGSRSSAEHRPSAHHFITSLYRFHRKHYGAAEAVALWSILMPYHGLRVLRLSARLPLQPGDAALRADLRTARERLLAHWTLLADRPGAGILARARELRLAQWCRIAGATPLQLATPIVLAAAIAALEGASIGLLVPIAVGVTERDFSFVQTLPVFSTVTAWRPGWFGHGPDAFAALFVLLAVAAFLAVVAKNALAYGTHVLTAHWHGLYLRRANDHLFRRCLGFGKLYYDRVSQGALQSVLGHTGELIDLLRFVQRGALHLLTLLAYAAVLFWISWRLTLFVLAFFPLTHLLVRGLSRRVERLSRQLNDATLARHAASHAILSALPLFAAYGQEEQAARTYAANAERLRRLNFRIDIVQGLLGPLQEVMLVTTVLATIAFLAFHLAAREPTELAVFLVFFFAVRAALPRFLGLYEVLLGLAAKAPRLADLARLLDDDGKFTVADGDVAFDGLRDGISVHGLRFGYTPGATVLDGIDIEFRKGTVTALVGPSGAGKSTLVHLLMGFYTAPARAIRLDGHPLESLRRSSLRARMALVAQDLFVFDDTLRANLLVGARGDVDEARLWDAVRRARLEDVVRRLPAGLDTRLGDRGAQLSGGERQRVAICRALLHEPEILILDEATSALDGETERRIQEALAELMRGRTAIVIAHRLATIRHADHVVFLEHGRVVEQGPPGTLLARGGRFATFCRSQQVWPA